MQEAQGTYNRKARVFMCREIDVKIKFESHLYCIIKLRSTLCTVLYITCKSTIQHIQTHAEKF